MIAKCCGVKYRPVEESFPIESYDGRLIEAAGSQSAADGRYRRYRSLGPLTGPRGESIWRASKTARGYVRFSFHPLVRCPLLLLFPSY